MFTAIAIVLVYFVFKDVDLQKLWGDIISMNVWWVLLSLGFATLGYILRMLRWVLLIEPLGYNPSKQNTFFALMFGYFANLALPRIGEVARCGVLYSKEKIPVDKLLGTVIIDRAFDLLTLALLGFIVFFCKIIIIRVFVRFFLISKFRNVLLCFYYLFRFFIT